MTPMRKQHSQELSLSDQGAGDFGLCSAEARVCPWLKCQRRWSGSCCGKFRVLTSKNL